MEHECAQQDMVGTLLNLWHLFNAGWSEYEMTDHVLVGSNNADV